MNFNQICYFDLFVSRIIIFPSVQAVNYYPRGGTKNAYTENQSNVKCFYGRKLLIKNLKNSVNIVDDLNNQFIIFKNLTFIFNEVMLWIKHSTVKIDFGERSLTLVYAFLVPPRVPHHR